LNPSEHKIIAVGEARKRLYHLRKKKKKIVFTNGCFDILHLGHIDYLEKARQLGDLLVVGVNSDASIKKIKGTDRPIIPERSRYRVIAALEFVDMVVPFEEETPLGLIQSLLPDILVKGSDYNIGNIIGADVVMQSGGSIETIDLVEGFSTSRIIEKIKKLNS